MTTAPRAPVARAFAFALLLPLLPPSPAASQGRPAEGVAGDAPLAVTWEAARFSPGEPLVMRGPGGAPMRLVLELAEAPSSEHDVPVRATDGRAMGWAAFRVLEDFQGFPGLRIPAGTRAVARWQTVRPGPGGEWRLTWIHLLAPDGTDLAARGGSRAGPGDGAGSPR